MSREDAATKGRRYVSEGRLVVDLVHDDIVHATCRGSGAVYTLGHDARAGGWWCDCQAKTTCSHLHALMLVTVRRAGGPGR